MLHPTLLAVPLLMVLAGVVERRHGRAIAGAVTSLPVVVIAGVLVVAHRSGLSAAAALTTSLGSHVLAQVATGGALLLASRRLPLLVGLGVAAATYAAGSVVVALLPPVAAWLAGAIALALARSWVAARTTGDAAGAAPPGRGAVALRAVVAWLAAVALVTGAQVAGPEIGGAIGAFPALTTTLAVMVWRRSGPAALAEVIAGLIRALPAYLAFCVAFAVSAAAVPTGAALAVATTVAAVTLTVALGQAEPEPAPRCG